MTEVFSEESSMDRGEATRGQVTKKFAGAGSVEIKATIPEHQIDAALTRYELNLEDADRFMYFFDSPDLRFFKSGIIARARRVVGGKHDSTIKFRNVVPDNIPKLWQKYKGFKIEADASEDGVVKSASLTLPVKKGLIKRVAAGQEPVASLFGEPQVMFLLATGKQNLDFENIVVLGPVKAWRWRITDPGLPWSITAELWQRDDQARIVEASIKVPIVQAAAAEAGFLAFLAELGAEHDKGQQTKTRWVLDYFAMRFQSPPNSK
jgi:hypothetical protein